VLLTPKSAGECGGCYRLYTRHWDTSFALLSASSFGLAVALETLTSLNPLTGIYLFSPPHLSLAHAGSDPRNARGRFSTQSALVAVWGNLELAFVEAAHLSGFIGALKVRLRVPPG
jgi:hypothetical protein